MFHCEEDNLNHFTPSRAFRTYICRKFRERLSTTINIRTSMEVTKYD